MCVKMSMSSDSSCMIIILNDMKYETLVFTFSRFSGGRGDHGGSGGKPGGRSG